MKTLLAANQGTAPQTINPDGKFDFLSVYNVGPDVLTVTVDGHSDKPIVIPASSGVSLDIKADRFSTTSAGTSSYMYVVLG